MTLLIGGPVDLKKENYFAAYSRDNLPVQVIFTVASRDVEALNVGVDDLRDSRVTIIKPADVRELSIEGPNRDPIKLLTKP